MPIYAGAAAVVALLFTLGFVQNWFFAVPVATALGMCLAFGKTALIPGVIVGFLLDLIIALAIGYVATTRLKAQRAAA